MAGDAIVVVMEHPRIEEEVEEDEDVVTIGMIPWLVIGVGCLAIWPMTIPTQVTHQLVVVALDPLEGVY